MFGRGFAQQPQVLFRAHEPCHHLWSEVSVHASDKLNSLDRAICGCDSLSLM